ncbi:ESF1 homolog [Phymastichus coffea]|uniref:ESF1 homolog n=1 Tax=Phymastichus coffea TaxID=108790 RepID=UPI00273BC9EA|nr:ESF1 homolog [Phymastichus coffea]
MEEMLKDKRFAHIAKDPKFRRIPKNERKVKIDKRFQSMFKDKKFAVKYTVDKRGRPVNQSSTENLKKYYELSSSEDESENELSEKSKAVKQTSNKPKYSEKDKKYIETKQTIEEESETDDIISENFSSNGSLLLVKKSANNSSIEQSDKDCGNEINDIEIKKNEEQLKVKRKNEKTLDKAVKDKLHDLSVDYARGEGILLTDSSSEEESSECDNVENEIEHDWGELDKDAETTEEITCRLAACNMDWDRIRAVDLMVLFNSFLPPEGVIKSVTIYPSEFGLQRMKEEEVKGPTELVESQAEKSDEDNENLDDDNEEGSSYSMEKLRKYQLNRLKYYYAVIDFNSASTANKIYTECDGLEYESSSTKLDLRFIPDNMTFDQEPKEFCDKLPDLTKYQPRMFTTTALQQVKVDLTWDETDTGRQEIIKKINSNNLNELEDDDIQAYLADELTCASDVEHDSEDQVKKQLEEVDEVNDNDNPIEKYKSLLRSLEKEKEDKKNEVHLEFSWGLEDKEKTENLIKQDIKKKQNKALGQFEQFIEKRKEKRKAKREQRKNNLKEDANEDSESDESIPEGIDMNDPYFAEELKNLKHKSKKRKINAKISEFDSDEEEEEKKRQVELELLLMDDEEDNKHHFSMKRIEEAESLSKSKKKRLSKRKKDLKDEASKDDFEVDVKDSRFDALYTSHHYNIDPADPHYRKTKGTDALVHEKLKRRKENNSITESFQKAGNEDKNRKNIATNAELINLVKSIKRNAQNLSKSLK